MAHKTQENNLLLLPYYKGYDSGAAYAKAAWYKGKEAQSFSPQGKPLFQHLCSSIETLSELHCSRVFIEV